jgi:hypothetical protein
MERKWLIGIARRVVVCAVLSLLALPAIIRYFSTDNSLGPEMQTFEKLQHLRLAGERLTSDEAAHIDTFSAFLGALKEKNLIVEPHASYYEQDGWRHPFRLDRMTPADQVIIQISSDGPNGKTEGGGGDHLYVRLTYDRDGKVTSYSPPFGKRN